MSVERRTISADKELLAQADARALRLRYKKFSHYVQALIESDVYYQGADSDFMHERPLPPENVPTTPSPKIKKRTAKTRPTRGSASGLTDKALEILKEGHPGGHGAPPKSSP